MYRKISRRLDETRMGNAGASVLPALPGRGEELLRYAKSCPGGFEKYLSGFLARGA